MGRIDELVSAEFSRWEQRGRGWQVFPEPVRPEPAFEEFTGYRLAQSELETDDGRRPGLLASLFDSLAKKINGPSPIRPEETVNPEPILSEQPLTCEFSASLAANLNVSKEAFEQFLLNLSMCREPIAFELLGVPNRVTAQFAACPDDALLVHRKLQAYFPEVAFHTHESTLEQTWNSCLGEDELVVEFGLAREFMLPLGSGKLDPFIGLVGALSELQPDELGLFQVLFQPAQERWPENILRSVTHADGKPLFVNSPELASAAESKISKPLYAAVVRIATKAETFERALQIASDLASSLRVFAHPQGNELIPLKNDDYAFYNHVEDVRRRQSRRSGMLLNIDELIGFVHLPSSAVRSPALEREAGKTKVAPAITWPATGILLGHNAHAGKTVEVRLSPEQRVRHTHIIGASGTGKSTLLFNVIRQDIENSEGVAVLDPHGDLIEQILGCIPKNRVADVVLVDPSDEEFSVGFNILAAHSNLEKNLLASDLVSIFERLSTSWGDQMNSVLNNAILAFLESSRGGTLVDLRRFLIEPEFRKDFLNSVHDPEVLYYWQKGFPFLSGNKSVGPILTRLDTFLGRKPIRNMVSQKENRLDIAEIMNSGKIFLAKLSQGKIGRENAYLLGSFILSKFQQSAMARQDVRESDRRDFWLYVDEFPNFITPSMAEILSGARKYRLGLVLAHQELRQMQKESEVSSAVLSNCYTRICFRLGDSDAKTLESGFSFFEAKDLQNLGTGEAVCRVERADSDFNLSIPLLPGTPEAEAAETRRLVTTVSREKYSIPQQQIEADQASATLSSTSEEAAKPFITRPLPAVPEAEEAKQTIGTSEAAPQPALEEQAKPAEAQDKGIGGNQHNLIRERIELVARRLGYSTSRESKDGQGQKIDVVLENSRRSIACEIAITTTIDHEVGNVAKCVRGGFKCIAVISTTADRLEKIKTAVGASLPPEQAASVAYYHPDKFLTFLEEVAVEDARKAHPATPNEKQYGKYKVKSIVAKLTQEEIKVRESTALGLLVETMRKKR